MALLLALRESHDFYIGDVRLVVSRVLSAYRCEVTGFGGTHLITEVGKVCVAPGVYLGVAIPDRMGGKVVRLAIDAPGQKILRGDLYRTVRVNGESPIVSPVCETCSGAGSIKVPMHAHLRVGPQADIQEVKCPDCS